MDLDCIIVFIPIKIRLYETNPIPNPLPNPVFNQNNLPHFLFLDQYDSTQ